MFHTTRSLFPLIAVAATLSLASSASAGQLDGLFWLASQMRSQIATVEAHAEATLCHCDGYDDVQDELRRLCHRMTRFEHALAEPIHCRADLRRLGRLAKRIDRQVCKLADEVEDALEDRNRFRTAHRQVRTAMSPVGYGTSIYRRGGIQITLGGLYGSRFHYASRPIGAVPTRVGYPSMLTLPPTWVGHGGGAHAGGSELRCEVRELHEMTSNLVRLLCR